MHKLFVVHVINIRDAALFIITLHEDLMMRTGNFSYAASDNKRDKREKTDFPGKPRARI